MVEFGLGCTSLSAALSWLDLVCTSFISIGPSLTRFGTSRPSSRAFSSLGYRDAIFAF